MLKYKDELTPRTLFHERLVSEVEKVSGETLAGCVDMLLGAMPDYWVDPTARQIRSMLKDAHFVEVVNKMGLVNVPIEDPDTAEAVLRTSLKPYNLQTWADSLQIDEKWRCVRGKTEAMDRPTKFREISEAMRLSMPAEQSGQSDLSAKAEEGSHTTGSEDDSAADQSDGHSSDEVRVHAYKQTRHGKTVPVRSYERHHTPSQHADEPRQDATEGDTTDATAASGSSDPKDSDANYSQGYSDAFHALMNGRDPAVLSRDPNSCPGYNQGVAAALKEIRQDPRWQKGFTDSLTGAVKPKNKDPYYLQGVRDHHRGDDAIGSMHDDSGDVLTFVAAAAYTTGLASAGIAAVAARVDEAAAGAALAASRLVQWLGNVTGGIWRSIAATGPLYSNMPIPSTFTLTTSAGRFWLNPNATKHLAQYAYERSLPKIEAQLRSLQTAVEIAARQGIQFGEEMLVNGWELRFKPAPGPGLLPRIYHARYIGGK